MKLIIAGSRDLFIKTDLIHKLIIEHKLEVTEVVSGAATGVDKCGESYANKYGISIKQFPANWNLHGKAAGPTRNRLMAKYADSAMVIMRKGKPTPGSSNMIDEMKKLNKLVHVCWV